MKEIYYDYSEGLNAPFWIQEIRTPRGKLIWTFTSPMELSYFLILALTALLIIRLFPLLAFLGSMRIVALILVPIKVAKLYVSYEPDGKKMHLFLIDFLVYVFSFIFNKKGLYKGKRVETSPRTIVFGKTKI